MEKFPCLRLAYEAAEAGGVKPVALNAADEVAVAAFLEGQIGFDDIPRVIEQVLSATKSRNLTSISQVLEVDSQARQSGPGQSSRQCSISRFVAAGLRGTYKSYVGFFIAVLAVGVILGFMILIHEFGHYAVAKLLGVRVEVFSIGFGKRLIGFRKGETDYRIAAIPLGGYVEDERREPHGSAHRRSCGVHVSSALASVS